MLFNELSFTIEVSEIGKAIGLQKMLKYGKEVLTKPLEILFNHVLLSGGFLSAWNISWLKHLHKGGKTTDINR